VRGAAAWRSVLRKSWKITAIQHGLLGYLHIELARNPSDVLHKHLTALTMGIAVDVWCRGLLPSA
jgi:hypothetical protein